MISAILKYSIGSLIYGGLITVVFLALFIFLIKGWYKDAVFKPISFVVLGILAIVILWNSTIICGALSIKSDISSTQAMIENTIRSYGLDNSAVVDKIQSNEIFRDVANQHPILGYYADNCDFSGWSIAQLPTVMCNTLKDYLNKIILKALLWSLGFVVVGAIVVIKTMDRTSGGRSSYRYSRTGNSTGRTKPVSSRYNGKRRTSRI